MENINDANNALPLFIFLFIIAFLALILLGLYALAQHRRLKTQQRWLTEHEDFLKEFVSHDFVWKHMRELAKAVANTQGYRIKVQRNPESSVSAKRRADERCREAYERYLHADTLAYHVRGGSQPWKSRLKGIVLGDEFQTLCGVVISLKLSKAEEEQLAKPPYERNLPLELAEA